MCIANYLSKLNKDCGVEDKFSLSKFHCIYYIKECKIGHLSDFLSSNKETGKNTIDLNYVKTRLVVKRSVHMLYL